MSWEFVASGGVLDAWQLSKYESYLEEGEFGKLELDLRLPVSSGVAAELETKLRQAGVEEVSVSTASPMLRIIFKKGFPWLAVIAATVLAMVVLAALIVGWRLFKAVVPEEWQPVVGTLGILLIIGLGFLLLKERL